MSPQTWRFRSGRKTTFFSQKIMLPTKKQSFEIHENQRPIFVSKERKKQSFEKPFFKTEKKQSFETIIFKDRKKQSFEKLSFKDRKKNSLLKNLFFF